MKKQIPLTQIESLAVRGIMIAYDRAMERAERAREEGLKVVLAEKGMKEIPDGLAIEPNRAGFPAAFIYDDGKPDPKPEPAPAALEDTPPAPAEGAPAP